MSVRTINGLEPTTPDLTTTHRLPTISAADALDDLDEGSSTHIPTGIEALDWALADVGPDSEQRGGVARGQVTEVWGPPGVGKTAVGIQLAANALVEGHHVVWVDCFHPLYFSRLSHVLNSVKGGKPSPSARGNFVHYSLPTLAHFLALLCRPRPTSIPPKSRLIVIDSFSALLNSSLPKDHNPSASSRSSGKNKGKNSPSRASARRTQTLQFVVSALQKLAATRDCAVVVLSQCATRMQRSERGATLVPAMGATVWEQGIATRVVLFRDWAWAREEESDDDKGGLVGLRFSGLQKLNGKNCVDLGSVAAFDIEPVGLVNAHHDASRQPVVSVGPPARKRKLGHTDLDEIPDSDGADEDFGWGEDDDDALPAMPPQWQGSEDLIIGTQRDSDGSQHGEEEEENEEDDDNDNDNVDGDARTESQSPSHVQSGTCGAPNPDSQLAL